ncbi:MAG TPA: translesion error-prone DNA polymerase V autoproteolytic subunit [Marinobacterium sp.]|nr:translesion error-prone DNA polymerase V autoproteolytic subunit [Marinobacterium sp.]
MSLTLLGAADVAASAIRVPFYIDKVPAGFPSPAQGYEEARLDLNELCIKRPSSTFMLRCDGDSMQDIGILSGDILVVDRSITAKHGDVVIASIDGDLTVKTLHLRPRTRLMPANRRYSPIELREGQELQIFGVVTNVVREMKRG